MTKINEILTSIILYSTISYILTLPNLEYGLIITILASQLNILLPKNYKHTLIHYIPLSILLIINPHITIPLITGYTSSIFIALLSKNGCKLIYPIRETTFTGPENYLENDTKKDHAATMFLITLVTITLLLSFNGEEIINTINENNNLETIMTNNNQNNNTHETVHYININPAYTSNKNITTTKTENQTTTIITDYEK
ncbi:hypothetical protein PXD04_00925 [Methanosphaera sp. ISO3-F5]|uniref:hypothetical protein n=1 Tax=Methanosphaera sp. ISO3-F5 TaxID=1452353 RepID=UPI002B258BDA|nr:hypothetical protein [Methanosphaera sp. ISO3-F5]WQH64390.1 hypothetical protein PXD04_00925 [Methanosphaera sp. ISO3-F5]